MTQVNITVARRAIHEDLIAEYVNRERYPDGFGFCPRLEEGQRFTVEWPVKPEGFPCDWAWADIQRAVAMIGFGADAPGSIAPVQP